MTSNPTRVDGEVGHSTDPATDDVADGADRTDGATATTGDVADLLDRELDRLESEIHRTLAGAGAIAELAATAEAADLPAQRLRAEALAAEVRSRAGGADQALGDLLDLLRQSQLASMAGLSRRIHTYLAMACDRLHLRGRALMHARASLAPVDTSSPAGPAVLDPSLDGARARAWQAESLAVSALVTFPEFEPSLVERAVWALRRDASPVVAAVHIARLAHAVAEPTTQDATDSTAHRTTGSTTGTTSGSEPGTAPPGTDVDELRRGLALVLADTAVGLMTEEPAAEAVSSWVSVALARVACGDADGARRAADRALAIEPDLGKCDCRDDPWITSAELFLLAHDPAEGLRVLNAPTRPAPLAATTRSRERLDRSRLHAAQGRWREAYAELVEHLRLEEEVASVARSTVVHDEAGRAVLDAARQRAREFEHLAHTDSLTGLPNRRAVEAWLDRFTEPGSPSVAVAIVDVDHFKSVNDRFSHLAGDDVLRRIAERLDSSTAGLTVDRMVGRLGGEEFVLAWRSSSPDECVTVSDLVRQQVATLLVEDVAPGLSVTVSIGVTFVDDPADLRGSPRLALRRADDALYQAKRAGRNTVRLG